MSSRRPELSEALKACRGALAWVAVFTAVLNVLYLTGSFFMMQVYDRVLPSRSVPTLVGIGILAIGLYGFQATLDIVRGRVLARLASGFAARLDGPVHRALVDLQFKAPALRQMEPARDLEQIRAFMTGAGPGALFDLPWLPLYLAICFLFHPIIGWTASLGAAMLIAIGFATEIGVHRPNLAAASLSARRNALAEVSKRNVEVLRAMGMERRLAALWTDAGLRYAAAQERAADVVGGFGGILRTFRMMLQSAVLAVGAYLAIHQEVTAGAIIACSVLSARALAPAEAAIGQWRSLSAARLAWRRLAGALAHVGVPPAPMNLPAPSRGMSVEALCVAPPAVARQVVQDVSFDLTAGQALGIIGPSASGKSSLVRALVGLWPPSRGSVRLDGATLDRWSRDTLGRHVGYLPQGVELFAGTVAQNIARLDPAPDADKVLAAAAAAGVHEMVLALPDGYETEIGEGGAVLSAGQRQRIGLARALYGDPFLVVLDEPNANLDHQGDEALALAIAGVRRRNGIAVVVAHRPSALSSVDQILVMNAGRRQAFGPKDAVLRDVLRVAAPSAARAPSSSAPRVERAV